MGWAAGLQLAALSIQGKGDVHRFIEAFTGSHAYLVDYLVEEVLQGQPEEVQTFLLQTSILERLTGGLCEAVTGRAGSAAILERLRQANLFVIPLDAEKRWYRYHHLFAEVLRHRLQSSSAPGGVHELHTRASQWHEHAGLNEEAIQHAFSAHDLERAIRLLEAFAENWIRRGENQTVYSWFSQIPTQTIRTHPRLCIIYAQLLLWRHQLDEASQYINEADLLISPTDSPLKGQVLSVRAAVAMRQSQYERTIELTRQAFALISPEDHVLRGRLKLAWGIALFWKDDHHQAAGAFEEAALFAQQAEDWHTALYAMADHALMFSLRGQLREAEKLFRRSLEFAAAHHLEYSIAANICYGHLTDLGHEWNDFAMVERYLEKSLKRTVIDQDPARKLNALFKVIKKLLALRDYVAADHTLQQAFELVKNYNLPNHVEVDVDYYQVRSWLAQGKLTAAIAWAEKRKLSPGDALTTIREPLYIALARILIAQSNPAPAVPLLQRLIDLAQRVGRVWIQFELRGLLVLALDANDQHEKACQFLRETIQVAEPEGYIRSLVETGDALLPLLKILYSEYHPSLPQTASYLNLLIGAFAETTPFTPAMFLTQPVGADGLSEPLSDREREILLYIDSGLSNREIADKLYISVSTVKTHINNLYGKLDANSRTQALAIARKRGVL